ncbi:MAG: site-2 protease family protein [Phycisphaerae bacterium]|nr:site-2 protease family protein [Phycisphaerae bacterium]
MPIEQLAMYVATTAIFLVSLTVHEYAHAWTAYRDGDDTAARMGRLTLNPLAHISLFGTIILPLIVHFGWAKPVPVNFAVLTRNQALKVALAGPASNLLLAVGLTVVFHLFPWHIMPALGVFLLLFAIWANIILALFNLIPIPPLDGSRIVDARLTSPQAIAAYRSFSRYGMLILIGFLYFGGFRIFILPVVGVLCRLLGLPYQIFM